MLTEVVKQGDCVVYIKDLLLDEEYKNQKMLRRTYYHMFDFELAGYSFNMLKADPYRQIFKSKMLYMNQNGILKKLSDFKLFKLSEREPLKPLQLQHFYLVLIGIAVGLTLSSLSFGIEFCCNCCSQKERKMQK